MTKRHRKKVQKEWSKKEMTPELRAMLDDYAQRIKELTIVMMNRPKPDQPLIPLESEAPDEVREILPDTHGSREDGGMPEEKGGD